MRFTQTGLVSLVLTTSLLTVTAQDFISQATIAYSFIADECVGSSWDLSTGYFRGIQQDSDNTDTDCATSFSTFTTMVDDLPNYIASLGTSGGGYDNSAITMFTTNPYY